MNPAQRQIALRKMALPAIPDDWDVVTVGSIAQKKPNSIVGGPFGSDLVSTDYVHSGVPVIRGQNMGQAFVSGDFVFVSDEKAKALSSNLAAPGDVVFTQRGTLGQVSVVPDSPFDRYLISQSQMKLSVDSQRFDVAFLCQYFSSAAGQQQVLESAIQTGVPHTNLTILRGYFLPRPPLPEQQAIAAALSDADGVVAGLERVIAKKRLIKQGAMQDLLTARRRLPGFSGEWKETRLGDIARVATGGRNNQDKDPMGEYPFFVRSDTVERIRSFSYDCEAILVPGEGRIGDIFHYINGKFDVHQRVYCISAFAEGTNGRFIYFVLRQFFGAHAMINTVKATVDSLRRPTFTGFGFRCPPSFDEQQAIAAVLSDMDAEIQTLGSRLAKARAVKEGMMQNLLTGRVRLV